MQSAISRTAGLALLVAGAAAASPVPGPNPNQAGISAHQRILQKIDEPALRRVLDQAVERNPGVLVADARARAAAQRAPQARALPDPVAGATAFLAPPETRTGPQRLSLSLTQAVPWSGKRERRELAAAWAAAALAAEAEAARLELVTEVREVFQEIAFVDEYREITGEFRSHLLQHEEIARARYSTGVGGGQGVIKLQAEITRVDKQLLDLEIRRVSLVARLNALRDRPASVAIEPSASSRSAPVELEVDALLGRALAGRPEIVAAAARVARADALLELAELGRRPDFRIGLTYTLVEPREDTPGRLLPPEGNGDDIFGLQGGVTWPLRGKRIEAGVAEALEHKLAAEESKRAAVLRIEAAIGDLAQRVPLSWRQLRLVEDLLIVQAEESLESAQSGYVAGTLNALDLLDAEHILFEARTARARAQTDFLIGLARLEGALAAPLPVTRITDTEGNAS